MVQGLNSSRVEVFCSLQTCPVAHPGSYTTVAYRGGGVQTPPPGNSEDIGGVLERMSKKNWRLDFLL